MWNRSMVESRRASWRKGCFRTDLRDREELAGKEEEGSHQGNSARRLRGKRADGLEKLNEVRRGQCGEREAGEEGAGLHTGRMTGLVNS